MPFNYGESLLPHVVTFQGIISSVSRVYRYYDEAMKASLENARFMRNDLTIMEPVEQRRRACALLNWHLEVDDEDDPAQKKLAEDLTKLVKQIPNFLKFKEVLLDAVWFGKNAVQFAWKWKRCNGVTPVNDFGQNLVIDRWKPLHGDKVVFRYDDGTREYDPNQVGIRVGAGYTAGDKGIQGRLSASGRRKVEPTDYGLAYFLEPYERQLLAIHKHMVEDGEYEDPQSAGKIHGLGIRSRIYWTWYLKQECFAHMMEFLERSSTGIEIWYYPWGNPDAKALVEKAAQDRIGNARNIILMPRPVGEDAQAFGIEMVQPNLAGIEAMRTLIDEYFGNLIMRYVLGQTMTNKPQSAGLGSDLPQIQLGSYLQIIRYDAINLGETLTTDIVDVLKEKNYPHLTDMPCRFVVDTESEDVESKLTAWKSAYEVGVKTKASDWLKMIGASKPEGEDEVIQNPITQQQDQLYQQFMEHKQQADAMGMTPEGQPQPGEAPQPSQEQGGMGEENPQGNKPGPQEGMEDELGMDGPQKFSMAHDTPQGGPYMDGQSDPEEFSRGIEEEMREHGMSREEARKTAMDHLRENPHYYSIVDKALAESEETTPEKYLMPNGDRMADAGIAEGRKEKDWQNVRAGGTSGAADNASAEHGCSCPAGSCVEPKKYANIYANLLARYYKSSTDEAQERFWNGDEREVVIIQDGRPMRYSRKHGQVSVSYVYKEAT
jgi:phage gp29-like protein